MLHTILGFAVPTIGALAVAAAWIRADRKTFPLNGPLPETPRQPYDSGSGLDQSHETPA